VRFDHVILAAGDLDAAAERLWREHGLASVVGGRHAGWGTGNRIVPLGSGYLELIGVVDRAEAEASEFGRLLLGQLEAKGDHLRGWCVAPNDFDATVSRLGIDVTTGSRTRPDGIVLSWRSAGFVDAMQDPSRPFFISWDVPVDLHPGRMEAGHRVSPKGIEWLEVSGDFAVVRHWLGPEEPALRVGVRPGDEQRVLAVGIGTDGDEIVLT
jgi:hypothetical protein